jgi:hypothetical protein
LLNALIIINTLEVLGEEAITQQLESLEEQAMLDLFMALPMETLDFMDLDSSDL